MEKNSLHKSILENSPIGYSYNKIIYNDRGESKDYEIIEVNKYVESMFDLKAKDLVGKRISQIYGNHKKNDASWNDFYYRIKKRCKNKENQKLPLHISGKYYKIESYSPAEGYLVIYIIDISKEVMLAVSKKKSELSMSEEKFSKAFHNSGVNMFISRFKDGEILEASETFLNFIGYKKEEVIGNKTLELGVFSDYGDRKALRQELKEHGKVSDKEIEILCRNGESRKGLINTVSLNINNEVCLLSTVIDITERVKYEEKILELSNRDPLTNIYNRRYIYTRLEEIIEEYKRNEKIFSVCIIDLDDFKLINDRYGHQVGDCVLKNFTKALSRNLRIYDVLGRYGGEEFIVILNYSNKEESSLILKRILDLVGSAVFNCDDNKIKLSFSAGIASCEELEKDEIGIEKLVGLADQRMYMAKNDGKSKIIYNS